VSAETSDTVHAVSTPEDIDTGDSTRFKSLKDKTGMVLTEVSVSSLPSDAAPLSVVRKSKILSLIVECEVFKRKTSEYERADGRSAALSETSGGCGLVSADD
jgi:hypothetical protein